MAVLVAAGNSIGERQANCRRLCEGRRHTGAKDNDERNERASHVTTALLADASLEMKTSSRDGTIGRTADGCTPAAAIAESSSRLAAAASPWSIQMCSRSPNTCAL